MAEKLKEGERKRARTMCGICPLSVESANKLNFHTVSGNSSLRYYGKTMSASFSLSLLEHRRKKQSESFSHLHVSFHHFSQCQVLAFVLLCVCVFLLIADFKSQSW